MLLGVKDRYMEHESLMEICDRFLGKSTEQGVKETGQDGGGDTSQVVGNTVGGRMQGIH
jgi:hypothetical protein